MRGFSLFFLLALVVAVGNAQSDQYLVSRQASVSLLPAFQSWSVKDGGVSFSEFSTVFSALFPLGRNASLSLRGGGAASGGDVSSLNGFTDAQVGLMYHVESLNTLFSLGLNLPTGKTAMSTEEFGTSVLFSTSLFDLQVPVFGQGFNINPGLAWVFPVGDAVVLGLAGAYQYRGSYTPLKGQSKFNPGDEITASGGIDIRASETVSLSTDFVFTKYTADQFGGKDVFASGNSYWINFQYKQYFRENELLGFVGYRTISKGQIAGAGGLVDEKDRLEPGRVDVKVLYLHPIGTQSSLGISAEARVFESTSAAFSGAKVFGAGLMPTFGLGSGVTIPTRFRFQIGSLGGGKTITGFDVGAGIACTF